MLGTIYKTKYKKFHISTDRFDPDLTCLFIVLQGSPLRKLCPTGGCHLWSKVWFEKRNTCNNSACNVQGIFPTTYRSSTVEERRTRVDLECKFPPFSVKFPRKSWFNFPAQLHAMHSQWTTIKSISFAPGSYNNHFLNNVDTEYICGYRIYWIIQ